MERRGKHQVSLAEVSHVVVDEADTLFDPSFVTETRRILSPMKDAFKLEGLPPTGRDAQLICVTAALSAVCMGF